MMVIGYKLNVSTDELIEEADMSGSGTAISRSFFFTLSHLFSSSLYVNSISDVLDPSIFTFSPVLPL
eukprot:1383100-Amorphochlora_amoeboformis.AAC.1